MTFLWANGVIPIKADSGNGFHLLIPLNKIEATDENIIRFKRAGDILAAKYGLDETVYNPARIWKLYGTKVCKGDEVPFEDRLHRRAHIWLPKDDIQYYDFDEVESVIESLGVPEQVQEPIKSSTVSVVRSSDNSQTNYIERFIEKHNIEVFARSEKPDKIIYNIRCPFCDNTDGVVLIYNTKGDYAGSYAFKCQHNSCKGKKWEDFKAMYEGQKKDEKKVKPKPKKSILGKYEINLTNASDNGKITRRGRASVAADIKKIIEERDPGDELFLCESRRDRLA